MSEAPLELHLQGMVVRRRRVVGYGNEREGWVRVEEDAGAKEVAPDRADVGQGQGLGAAEGLLPREVPLVASRELQVGVGDQYRIDGRARRRGRRGRVLGAQRIGSEQETLAHDVRKVAGDPAERALPEVVEH